MAEENLQLWMGGGGGWRCWCADLDHGRGSDKMLCVIDRKGQGIKTGLAKQPKGLKWAAVLAQ